MPRRLVLASIALALAALFYFPGTILKGWPGQAWALACLAPIFLVVLLAGLQRAAEARDRSRS